MKAVFINEFGGAENLEVKNVADLPHPNGSEVLVRVKAAGLNRADILQRKGLYPAPKDFPQKIPGLEFAGEVTETGENVKKIKTGDRVFGITAGGAQAEYVLTDEFQLAEIPSNLNFIEAAAIPEAFITAHDAIFSQGNLRAGETLLIHAVGSGVGLAALQIAKARNIKIFGTSRTAEKLERCREFGLDAGIVMTEDVLEENAVYFAEIIRAKNGGIGADVILDLVGAKYFQANLKSLEKKGRLILVGLTGGTKTEINLAEALSKRLKIIGTVLRSRTGEEKAGATRKFIEEVLPLVLQGKIKPNVDRVFNFNEVRRAHEYLESNASFGKVILEL